ncbi:LytTR family DNA-binding domain-containing protein [Altererythrobacter sp. GH1-8]|uniref:LytTR family DNA-binding domain-containing protein n=1 Tax=Altererythrobacter sp. GH1-8 TaxID=3349333 RepID=UPI00374D495C
MKIQRFLVLNLALPVLLALYIAVAQALPYSNSAPIKVFIVYCATAIPFYFVAQAFSFGFLKALERVLWHRALALLMGAIAAILFGYFYLELVGSLIWYHVPFLVGGLSPGFEPAASGFLDYLASSTSLLFPLIWMLANLIYEAISRDRLFFPDRMNKSERAHRGERHSRSGAGTGQVATTFLTKIPQHLGRNLIALEAQEHYVRVYTDHGSELVLYRFGDAVTELEAIGFGVQVHRSFFVAPNAIQEIKRSGKSFSLQMQNGLEVPVSQSYRGIVARIHDRASVDLFPTNRGNSIS